MGRDRGPREASVGQPFPKPRQIPGEVLRRRVAPVDVLGEAPLDDPAQGNRRFRRHGRERCGLFPDDRRHCLGTARADERPLAGGHLVEDRSERELVRSEVERLAERLLGRHVPHGADDHAGLGPGRDRGRVRQLAALPRRLDQLDEAEVEDLDDPLPRHHYVLGLQVPMDDAGRVRLGQPVGDLSRERQKSLERKGAAREQQLPKGVSLDKLHGHPRDAVRRSDVVDRDDVRMVEG